MMETLDQQQATNSTLNIESHSGHLETSSTTPSEEDDFEDNNEAFALETKEKTQKQMSFHPQLILKKIADENRENPKEAAIENGSSKEHPRESANNADDSSHPPAINCVKIESTTNDDTKVADDKPSASNEASSDDHKLGINIKTEEESSSHTNNCNNGIETPSLDVKIVEDYESSEDDADERNDDIATCSPAIKSMEEETSSQDLEVIIKAEPCDDFKVEEKSPLVDIKTDDEDVSSPVVTILKHNPQHNLKDVVQEVSSPVLVVDSQDEETSSTTIKTIDKRSDSPLSTLEEDKIPSLSLKISTEIKSEEQSNSVDDEEAQFEVASPSAAAAKLDESEAGSSAAQQQLNLRTAAAANPSPAYKIDDLSPASIPDDEESLQDFDIKVKLDDASLTPPSPEEIIKIESDSEDEVVAIEPPFEEERVACQDDNNLVQLPVETSVKIKINGAHTPMLLQTEQPDAKEASEKDCVEQQHHMKEEAEEMVETGENEAVIASNEVEPAHEHQAEPQIEQNNYTRSSRSSSVSSTSQQLVIDHPESEHNAKQQLKQQKQPEIEQQQQKDEALVESGEQEQEEQSLHATKRRRSDSINEICSKQPRIENESSLLMQRLQAPAQNSNELGKLLRCYKCNANSFDNWQQLIAHFALCGQPKEAASSVEAPTTVEPPPTSESVPLAVPVPAPSQPTIQKERFFRCARCSTVHQCWNFFLHMRDVHHRYICLYCSHVFASVEKLSLHLENKHDMDQRHFNTVDAWQTLQTQEDRVRYLVCCNCQASFELGSQFDNHDCAELMQPCALCGQKAGHINGCRNGRSATSARKKSAVRRKRKSARSKPHLDEPMQGVKQLEELPNWMETEAVPQELPQPAIHENNIPAPSEDVPQEEAPPKLVVPKIMLRVPKEFQKSVDAELSSTDTEDDDNDELPSTAADCSRSPAPLLTVDAVNERQELLSLPVSSLSEDTETATETASMFHEATHTPANVSVDLEDDDSHTAKLTQALAEFERTKLDIQRARADIMAKKEQLLQVRQQEQQEELQHQHQEQEQQQRRWSPTPPASPHNNHINHETHVPKEQNELQAAERTASPSGTNSQEPELAESATTAPAPVQQRRDTQGSECMDIDDSLTVEQHPQQQQQQSDQTPAEAMQPATPPPPADGIIVAGTDTVTVDLQLDRPLDKFELVDFVRLCLTTVAPSCLYCNHARRIAVNAKQLVLHLIAKHRFTATVDSITAEELHAETIVSRLKSYLPLVEGDHYLNSASCCTLERERFALPFNERIYECFQCRFVTATHKELYTHNRRLHVKMNITCAMCSLNYFSYSELLCHICPGETSSHVYDVQYRCCFCETPPLPSAFRLMVHLRKKHQTCDICLEDCHSQAKLSAHVWKHKLLHLCYRCGIAYRSKQDISKHLFWKHGTESSSCKRCLQKRWRHVYHFCVPATQFTCEQCQYSFSKAIYLEVHKRQHDGDFRYACNEEQCEEKFVSRKLLLKHAAQHEVKELPGNETLPVEGAKLPAEEDKRSDSQQPENNEQAEDIKTEADQVKSPKAEAADQIDGETSQQQAAAVKSPKAAEQEQPRKRRKKTKRNKASLEDLNLIAPNLSESDSSDDSDSDAARSVGAQPETSSHGTLPMRVPASVDDLDMPKVMLSPSSESDNEEDKSDKDKELIKQPAAEDEQKQEKSSELPKQENDMEVSNDEQKPKLETSTESAAEEVADIWKNLLQHQPSVGKMETDAVPTAVETEPSEDQLRPAKLHVAYSDHDYCKMQRTPPPTPVPSAKKSQSSPNKAKRGNASSDSDSSSSSSSSDSDSSSCSCGSNCSCSSSGSSSSDDDSDNESTSSATAKKAQKKNNELPETKSSEEFLNVTSINEEEPRPETPKPNVPLYNESDFDTAVSDTDEEFYDAHPQKTASDLLAQKRQALLLAHAPAHEVPAERSNFDIVENSRPSTPSLPEEAAAFADRRERVSKNKKKKRERKSTCKSTSQAKFTLTSTPDLTASQHLLAKLSSQLADATYSDPARSNIAAAATQFQLQNQQMLTDSMTLTPLTHRPAWQPRMSGGSSCSDADGQLKRSKRTRRPNKFYGYTSDDEMMSSVLAPPLQVGMQLIKPQPPPQLTWAKEDLPTPPKQQRSRNNHSDQHSHHQHLHSNGSTSRTKRNKRAPQSGGSGSAKRSAKRLKPQLVAEHQGHHHQSQAMPPIPTLKIRPALLPVSVAASESSDSSSDDENAEINVTSLLPLTMPMAPTTMLPTVVQPVAPPVVPLPVAPPPPPATKAFNQPIPPALLPNPDFATLQYFKANNIRYPIRPPEGARLAREGESVYCYCRCPYDEVSEMIACDGSNCLIEWFHFECVGIMVAPQGKWFCAECRPKYTEGLYPGVRGK